MIHLQAQILVAVFLGTNITMPFLMNELDIPLKEAYEILGQLSVMRLLTINKSSNSHDSVKSLKLTTLASDALRPHLHDKDIYQVATNLITHLNKIYHPPIPITKEKAKPLSNSNETSYLRIKSWVRFNSPVLDIQIKKKFHKSNYEDVMSGFESDKQIKMENVVGNLRIITYIPRNKVRS